MCPTFLGWNRLWQHRQPQCYSYASSNMSKAALLQHSATTPTAVHYTSTATVIVTHDMLRTLSMKGVRTRRNTNKQPTSNNNNQHPANNQSQQPEASEVPMGTASKNLQHPTGQQQERPTVRPTSSHEPARTTDRTQWQTAAANTIRASTNKHHEQPTTKEHNKEQ